MTLNIIRVFFHKMTSSSQSLLAPINVRSMKVLDRDKFLRNIQIPVLKVKTDGLSAVLQLLKPLFLKLSSFKPVQDTDKEDQTFTKVLYLHPDLVTKWEDIPENMREKLKDYKISEDNFGKKDVQFGYDNWSQDTIFKEVLPEGEEIVSGFSQIGHIIHLNLRDHLIGYRQLIGQVLVDKIKACRTVVNKSNIIDNTYRNFNMEVIAGEEDFIVSVRESNCNFKFDFSKVYWNPRLAREHERIIEFLRPSDILFDVFCGVGPFAIPASKRKCRVFANDLNPESFKWLNYNAEKNKVNQKMFNSYNKDGKDFILNEFKDFIHDLYLNNHKINGSKIHVTMNLPAIAVEFLKYFKGLIKDKEIYDKFDFNVIVYVYCFANGDESECVLSAKQMVSDNIGCDMSSHIIDVFNVRKVSPTKLMMRVMFTLTKDVIFDSELNSLKEPPSKKQCIEN